MLCDLETSFSLSLSYSGLFPFLMSSPCLVNGGCRTYRLDLDIITKSSSLSSSSSTTSDSSIYTPFSIATKRARSPRKRPNQNSAEAAALLSTISPKLFSPAILLQRSNCFPVRLPSHSATDDSTLLLLEKPSPENAPIRLDLNVSDASLCSRPYCQFKDPGSPEFDAESILDEEGEECIDSIIGVGNLSVSSGGVKEGGLDCLMGFGFGILSNMKQALRQKDKGEWWRADVVDVKDIAPKMNVELEKAKKKKKDKLETGDSSYEDGILELRLWLKLDYDEVIKEWSGGSPFFDEPASVESATNVIARLASIDLLPDGGGGVLREASMQRYKEKRTTRLFSKKIRYQVRKVNADHRPRLKGRFVRTQSLLHEPLAEENQLRNIVDLIHCTRTFVSCSFDALQCLSSS